MAQVPLQEDDHNSMSVNVPGSDPSTMVELKNELANSASPYLRSHKDNLVAWQEWSLKSIALAQAQKKPIFLSIGYSACHWCHVMSHESFESPDIAKLLNSSFVPIKVDRESRPDLDEIYMNYVTATTGSGGWPLNVFLTPDLQPLFGGTYWPSPGSETTLPRIADSNEDRPLNFLDIIEKICNSWQNERERCLASAADITRQLQQFAAEGIHGRNSGLVKEDSSDDNAPEPLELDLLDDALDHFVSRYDSIHGGFISGAGTHGPKFTTPANLTFLLRIGASITRPLTHTRFGFPSPVPGILGKKSCATAASMALHTLHSMSRSGLRDHLGNGFHRYSATPNWNLPHFEKMLYDNAQLLAVYCDAWALGRDPEILGTIYDLVEYLTDPMSPIVRSEGGWFASEDADSPPSLAATDRAHQQKKEGAFYVWTMKELTSILGERDSSIIARHFGVKEHGNIPQKMDVKDEFINQNVLHINATPSVLAKEFGLKEDEVVHIIKKGKKLLIDFRKTQRAAPDVDEKVVLSWNALAISALARASNTLSSFDESRARMSKETAAKSISFIKAKMFNNKTGKLTRVYSDRNPMSPESQDLAFVDDYAYLIQSLRTMFDLTCEQHYLDWALELQAILDRDFGAGGNGGYYQSAITAPTIKSQTDTPESKETSEQILNLKPGTDSDLPSPNGIIAGNLLYLSSYVSSLSSSNSDMTGASTSSPPQSSQLDPKSDVFLVQARNTIDAFAPEIIQHPFLYVSLLSAVVLDTVGVKSLLIPPVVDMDEIEIERRSLRGFGRTLVRSSALKQGEVVICEKSIAPANALSSPLSSNTIGSGGVCRPLRDGELDVADDTFDELEEAQGDR